MLGASSSSREDCGATLFPSPHSLPRGQPSVSLHTLGRSVLTIAVNNKCRVRDVLRVGCTECRIAQERLFGVAERVPAEGLGCDSPRNEYLFLDPDQYLHKYIGKQSRIPWVANKADNTKRLVLYLRVITYVDDMRLITCSMTLENYYIQLRENVLDQWVGTNSVSEERCWELAVLALRADKGDCPGGFFRVDQYFPLWLIELRGLDYIKKAMLAANAELNVTKRDAMTEFCQIATRPPYALNTHVYGMRRHKMDTVDRALFTISPIGVAVSAVGEGGDCVVLKSLEWSKIARLSFDRRCVTIGGMDGGRTRLYAHTETKAKHILSLCRTVHQTLLGFSSIHLPKIAEGEEKSIDDAISASTSGVVSDFDRREIREEIEEETEEDVDEGHETRTESSSIRESEKRSITKSSSSIVESCTQTCPSLMMLSSSMLSPDSPISESDDQVYFHPVPSPSPPQHSPPLPLPTRSPPPTFSVPPPPTYPHDYMIPGPSNGSSMWSQNENGDVVFIPHHYETAIASTSSTSSVGSRSNSIVNGNGEKLLMRSTIPSTRNHSSISLRDLGAARDLSRLSTSSAYNPNFPLIPSSHALPPRLSSHSESRIDSLDAPMSSVFLPPYPGINYTSHDVPSSPPSQRTATAISRVQSMPAHHHSAIQSSLNDSMCLPQRREPPPYNKAAAAAAVARQVQQRKEVTVAEGGRNGPPAYPQPSLLSTSAPSRSSPPLPPSSISLENLPNNGNPNQFKLLKALCADFQPVHRPIPRQYEPHSLVQIVPFSQLPQPMPNFIERVQDMPYETPWPSEIVGLPDPPPYPGGIPHLIT